MVADRSYTSINIGDKESFSKTISESDIYNFAGVTGDFNPLHVDKEYAKNTRFNDRISHGMLSASLISTVIGTKLPGANTIYLSQDVKFVAPVYIGDTLTAEVEVTEKRDDKQIIDLKTVIYNQEGTIVVDGTAKVMKMKEKVVKMTSQ
ncbi:MaoC family dehydratase [Natranaerofaba carboxydovora]|uniref:MaoC family dehydratase n=1 Tax=Natranaerofaba carboxydovora TaxID=2742683 RepID=UPI001F12B92A|nr:MaoC family dehydratase [Natranaerofaba carboxydovora]